MSQGFDDEALVAAVPEQVEDIADAIPAAATFAVIVPAASSLDLPPDGLQFLKQKLAELAARYADKDKRALEEALTQFDAAAIFATGEIEDLSLAVALRFRDAEPIERAIADVGAEKIGAHTWKLGPGRWKQFFTWIPKARMLVGSSTVDGLRAALDALSKRHDDRAASFRGHRDPTRVFLYADLHRLYQDHHLLADGALVSGTLGLAASDVVVSLRGDRAPRVASVLTPHAHDALAQLPANPSVAFDLSLRRAPGKTLHDALIEADRSQPEAGVLAWVERALRELGVTFPQLDALVGDSLTVGAYASGPVDPSEIPASVGLVAMVAIADASAAQALMTELRAKLKSSSVTWEGDVARFDLGPERNVRVELERDRLVVTLGTRTAIDALASKRAATPLFGSTAQYAGYKKLAAPTSHVAIFADGVQLSTQLPKFPFSFGRDEVSGIDLSFEDHAAGTDVRIRGAAALATLGGALSFIMSRERSSVSSAKTREARQSVGALARAAVAAFDRSHALCKSTKNPVPASVPVKGRKYAPQFKEGADFRTGDEGTGWKCLQFMMTSPTHYRYDYRAGGDYKCVARGGVDPGPDGFEASAEGDLDGDGVTSLFCATGKVVKGSLVVDPSVFTVDELE